MGTEIPTAQFSKDEVAEFNQRLKQETQLLLTWFQQQQLEKQHGTFGFELEACIVDQQGQPNPCNQALLAEIDNPLVVPELAQFNIEFNCGPQQPQANLFSKTYDKLNYLWQLAQQHANKLNSRLLAIGILPTLSEQNMTVATMSEQNRYAALNQQILRSRHFRPIEIEINGHDHLQITRYDIMLEAATTALQIHLQLDPCKAHRYYNAALLISAPMVALSGNSPFLFGKDLWYETRVPLFERSLTIHSHAHNHLPERVFFGSGFVKQCVSEVFLENLQDFAVLLPSVSETCTEKMHHLRLHNGTIWRWNRPLIDINANGKPHLRLEHRVPASGPSLQDCIANMAFFLGAIYYLAELPEPPEQHISFAAVKNNFYATAKHGFAKPLTWLNNRQVDLSQLLLKELLPNAQQALIKLGIDAEDIDYYLNTLIKQRVLTQQTGTQWQRAYYHKHGQDLQQLTCAYLSQQQSAKPIFEWEL
jgi:gamma-glutamyl:cysteine ligase YbdK (ATP-grasp superfamily)